MQLTLMKIDTGLQAKKGKIMFKESVGSYVTRRQQCLLVKFVFRKTLVFGQCWLRKSPLFMNDWKI